MTKYANWTRCKHPHPPPPWQWNLSCQTDWHSFLSNISRHPLLAEIFNSPISAGTYRGQRVGTLVLYSANWSEPHIMPWGRKAALCKRVYVLCRSTTVIPSARICGSSCAPPMAKVSDHSSSSGPDLDMNRWVWSVLTSRSRGESISNFIFVVFSTAILTVTPNKLLVRLQIWVAKIENWHETSINAQIKYSTGLVKVRASWKMLLTAL